MAGRNIEDTGGCVTVLFRHGAAVPRISLRVTASDEAFAAFTLNEQEQAVLHVLRGSDRPLPLREIHSRLPASVSAPQVKRALARLRELGLATSTGHGVAARWRSRPEQWTR